MIGRIFDIIPYGRKKQIIEKIICLYTLVMVLVMIFSSVIIPIVGAKEKVLPDTASSTAASTTSDDSDEKVLPDTASSTAVSTTSDDSDEKVLPDTVYKTLPDAAVNHSNVISISEKDLGDIVQGTINEVVPDNVQETSIIEVNFEASSNLNNVQFSVARFEQKPEEIKEIPLEENRNSTVYKYLDIKLTSNETYVGETGIASMTFTFTVEKSWIVENNIDKLTVEMLRYHDGEWQHLNTTLISENDTAIVYEAETPGLSTFAVVGSEIVEVSASYVEETNQISWILNVVIIFSSTIILGVVLVKARFIYKNETKQ